MENIHFYISAMPFVALNITLNINENFFKEKDIAYVSKNWFNFFHYDFISGNAITFSQNNIILTESLAKKYYGNKQALGEVIYIDSTAYRVQAVIKNNPTNSSGALRQG